jgi:hypothetical protein
MGTIRWILHGGLIKSILQKRELDEHPPIKYPLVFVVFVLWLLEDGLEVHAY